MGTGLLPDSSTNRLVPTIHDGGAPNRLGLEAFDLPPSEPKGERVAANRMPMAQPFDYAPSELRHSMDRIVNLVFSECITPTLRVAR